MAGSTIYAYRKESYKDKMTFIIHRDSIPAMDQFNRKLRAAEEKTGELRLLKLVLDYHFRKRTLDQNAYMWALYDIEAYAHNAGKSGAESQMVKPWDLYEHDVERYCPVVEIYMKEEYVQYIMQEYRKAKVMAVKNGRAKIAIWITTSHFDTRQMAEWIERILTRLAYFGIPTEKQAEVLQGWKDWRQMLNDAKINLHDDVTTEKEYKESVIICEACGTYLGNGGGSLAHIAARGMGGNQEDWKDAPTNWLHLCDTCHGLWDNGKGRAAFLKRYSHLKNKIEEAVKKEIVTEPARELDIF